MSEEQAATTIVIADPDNDAEIELTLTLASALSAKDAPTLDAEEKLSAMCTSVRGGLLRTMRPEFRRHLSDRVVPLLLRPKPQCGDAVRDYWAGVRTGQADKLARALIEANSAIEKELRGTM